MIRGQEGHWGAQREKPKATVAAQGGVVVAGGTGSRLGWQECLTTLAVGKGRTVIKLWQAVGAGDTSDLPTDLLTSRMHPPRKHHDSLR